jgi:hypothetical protein
LATVPEALRGTVAGVEPGRRGKSRRHYQVMLCDDLEIEEL